MNVIRLSYEEMHQHRERLTLAATEGTLTETMLHEAVQLVVEGPRSDGPPESIGCQWICTHIAEFKQVVKDPVAFMWQHLGNSYFAPLVVLHAELLQLLPEVGRASYVREAIMRHGAWNMGWIKASLEAGVPQGELAEIVLDRLMATTVKEGCVNFLSDFLRYGCGHVERMNSLGSEGDRRRWLLEESTPWSVLDTGQFADAIHICVAKAPAEVLAQYDRIQLRLDDETLQRVMTMAAYKIDHVCCPAVLRTLPIDDRLALVRRIKTVDVHAQVVTAQFLVEVILIRGITLYEEVLPVFQQMNAAAVYRNIYSMLVDAEKKGGQQKIIADDLERLLADWCRAEGYYFGVIEESTYTNPRTKQSQQQKGVQNGGITYVQDRMQHRYFPKVGEAVLYKPSQGHRLTPWVTSVMFYPACHGGEA